MWRHDNSSNKLNIPCSWKLTKDPIDLFIDLCDSNYDTLIVFSDYRRRSKIWLNDHSHGSQSQAHQPQCHEGPLKAVTHAF